jgi:hypothetical protein
MTTSETTVASVPAPRRWLRIVLAILAAYELWDALAALPILFVDYGHETALLRFAQALVSVRIVLAPLVTVAALWFAATGKLRHAIIALAALVLLTWVLDDVWSIPINGLELDFTLGGLVVVLKIFIFPLAAIAAIYLALKDRRLGLACALVALPTVVKWIGIMLFAIAMAMYGF